MLYIPKDRTVSIVPDLVNLPARIALPRDRRFAFGVLVASGIWMMLGLLSAIWLPLIWPWLDFPTIFVVTAIITAVALVGGIGALRRYAGEDEISIDERGISVRKYGWFTRTDETFSWNETQNVESTQTGGYEVVSVTFKKPDNEPIPVFIGRDASRAMATQTQVKRLAGMNSG